MSEVVNTYLYALTSQYPLIVFVFYIPYRRKKQCIVTLIFIVLAAGVPIGMTE